MRTSTSWNKELSEKELTPTLPTTAPEKLLDIYLLLSLFTFFKKSKSFITPLNFIFVTYYYLAKKDPIFKANFMYMFFIIFEIDFGLYF